MKSNLIAASCTLTAALTFAASALADEPATKIVFASGPDDTNTVQHLVEAFNTEHRGTVHVTWRPMPRDNNAHHQQLSTGFAAGSAKPHVIAGDVIWTAEFAKKGWVRDVTQRFYRAFEKAAFLERALESATYRLRIWGVPWYSDASLLFYRRDLLAKSGFTAPPRTWGELKTMARKVMEDSGTRHGFVFQGANYEGGAANAVEYIWSAGGRALAGKLTPTGAFGSVTETSVIEIDSPKAARGFDIPRALITEGISPAAVVEYRERESLEVFLAGDAVFLRNWPYAYGVLEKSGLGSEAVGVTALPAASAEETGYSCLGGWNFMMNARANEREREAAWTFIRYMTSAPVQKRQALGAGYLPVLRRLYDDPEIASAVPVLTAGKKVLSESIRVRPVSPFYTQMSSHIAEAFHRTLKGEITGAQAVTLLEKKLRAIAVRNR